MKLKIALWILLATMVFVSWSMWVFTNNLDPVVRWQFREKPIHEFTRFLFAHKAWLLAYPIPWFPYCILATFRKTVTVESVLLFAAIVFAGIAFLVLFTAFALTLPWIQIVNVM